MSPKSWGVRPADGGDLNFIYSTWIRSFWSDSESTRHIDMDTFFKGYPAVIDAILARSKVVVAHDPAEPAVIYGYLVAEPPVVHYGFVKSNFRRLGIARSLVEHLKCGPTYTHRTGAGREALKTHPEFHYNPYLLYTKGESDVRSKESPG